MGIISDGRFVWESLVRDLYERFVWELVFSFLHANSLKTPGINATK